MTELTIRSNNQLAPVVTMADLGQVADQVAADKVFAEYRSRQADQTIRRQDADLALFADYLGEVGTTGYTDPDGRPQPLTAEALANDPAAWRGVSHGLVAGFVRWQLGRGYAVGSINVRLATVRRYAQLAASAGTVSPDALVLIKTVRGYAGPQVERIDKQRRDADVPTRTGRKKADPVLISKAEAEALKRNHEDNPQGRRDALLMCLLIDHGLRVGELSGLQVGDFDLANRQFRFFRQKVNKTQTHTMTDDTFNAAAVYLQRDALPLGPLFRGSRRDGRLHAGGWAVQNINHRVRILGREIAQRDNLSPHDLRHYWATTAARNGTPIDRLQDAGGWTNPVTPLTRYVGPAKIANQGVILE